MSNSEQVTAVDHRGEAERMVRRGMNAGSFSAETRAMLANANATLAVAEELRALRGEAEKLREQADEQFTWWKRVQR